MKKSISLILNIFTSAIMIFMLIVLVIILFTEYPVSSPDFLINQVEKSNTVTAVYNSLIEKYKNQSNATAIPSEVYTSAISEEWVATSVESYIFYFYQSPETKNDIIDFTEIEKSITEYFEKYAIDNNVVKDDVYTEKLSEVIENTKREIIDAVDVYRTELLRKTTLINKIFWLREHIKKILISAVMIISVLIFILIMLKNPLYWIATALFSSGLLIIIPTACLLATSYIMNFSIKDYVVYNLVTKTLSSVVYIFLNAGIVMFLIGVIIIMLTIIVKRKKNDNKQI